MVLGMREVAEERPPWRDCRKGDCESFHKLGWWVKTGWKDQGSNWIQSRLRSPLLPWLEKTRKRSAVVEDGGSGMEASCHDSQSPVLGTVKEPRSVPSGAPRRHSMVPPTPPLAKRAVRRAALEGLTDLNWIH